MFLPKDAFTYAPIESSPHLSNKHCHETIQTPNWKQSETESIDDREMSTLRL